jgi:hypothetical protein
MSGEIKAILFLKMWNQNKGQDGEKGRGERDDIQYGMHYIE